MPSLSVVATALVGFTGILILAFASWLLKPWGTVKVALYQTPTFTATSTATPFSTSTPTATPTRTPTPTATPEVITYMVKRGDTLESLAERFGTTVEAIKALNGLTGDNPIIKWGVEILIPVESEGVGGGAEMTPTPAPVGGFDLVTPVAMVTATASLPTTYVVQPGDTLMAIAERFGVSWQALMEANGISDPTDLQVGQELIISLRGPTPTATPTPMPPTPTPSFTLLYKAPVLLGPPNEEVFGAGVAATGEGSGPLLNWMSVGLLKEEEWYLVRVVYVAQEGTAREVVELTKATSYRLSSEMRPSEEALSRLFRWDVTVVRLREGSASPIAISATSETRTFYWY